jgi:RHH-type transcriptional regulator, rel operon repressor / antitoxin RelB
MKKPADKQEAVTVRLDGRLRRRLDALARSMDRSNAFLAAEAIAGYVDQQEWQVAAIREGVRQADAGEFAPRASVERLLNRDRTSR